MVVLKFGRGCEIIIDEEVKDVGISDGRTAIAKLVFDGGVEFTGHPRKRHLCLD